MKKVFSLLLLLCLLLTACGPKVPEKTADGSPWQKNWDNVGSLLGVEPMEGWMVSRNEDALAAEGTFYVTWAKGDSFSYSNAEGKDITAYDNQIYLLVTESETEAEAKENAALFDQLTDERYPDADHTSEELAGQTFTVSSYDFPAAHYQLHGASATAVRGNWAIHVDVITRNADAHTVLEDFWSHCHWAA